MSDDRDLQRLKGEEDWYGFLTRENLDLVANRIRAMLDGRQYTCVTVWTNGRPEVKAGQSNASVETLRGEDRRWSGGIDLDIGGFPRRIRTRATNGTDVYRHDRQWRVEIDFSDNRLTIDYPAPAGAPVHIVIVLEPADAARTELGRIRALVAERLGAPPPDGMSTLDAVLSLAAQIPDDWASDDLEGPTK